MKKDNVIALQDNKIYQETAQPKSVIIHNNLVAQVNYALASGIAIDELWQILEQCGLFEGKKSA